MSYEKISKPVKYNILSTETQNYKVDKINNWKSVNIWINYYQLKVKYSCWFLPFNIWWTCCFREFAGGAGAVTSAVINAKYQSPEEEEMKSHSLEMEKIARYFGVGVKMKKSNP